MEDIAVNPRFHILKFNDINDINEAAVFFGALSGFLSDLQGMTSQVASSSKIGDDAILSMNHEGIIP